jgi:hypothetical protein
LGGPNSCSLDDGVPFRRFGVSRANIGSKEQDMTALAQHTTFYHLICYDVNVNAACVPQNNCPRPALLDDLDGINND